MLRELWRKLCRCDRRRASVPVVLDRRAHSMKQADAHLKQAIDRLGEAVLRRVGGSNDHT